MPKAVRFENYGGIDVLRVEGVPPPGPGGGEGPGPGKAGGGKPREGQNREGP